MQRLGKLLDLHPFLLVPADEAASTDVPTGCRLFHIVPQQYYLLTEARADFRRLALVREILAEHLELFDANTVFKHDNDLLRQEINLVFKINKDLTDDLTGIASAFAPLEAYVRYAVLNSQTTLYNSGVKPQALEVCQRRLQIQKEFSLVVSTGELFAIRSEGIAGVFESDMPLSDTVRELIRLKICWLGMQNRQRRLVDGLLELQKTYQSNTPDASFAQGKPVADDPDLNPQYRELQLKFQSLLQQAITDSLTTAFNRNKVNEILEELTHREGRTFSVILSDIDHFKTVNDTYGHQEGDRVLVEYVQVTRQALRKTDILARWGGEEFLIVMEDTSLNHATARAEVLRQRIAAHRFFSDRMITCSYGVAEWQAGDDVASTIAKTDQALYQAKRDGRNRVVASILQGPEPSLEINSD